MLADSQVVRRDGKLALAGELRMADATLVWRKLRELAAGQKDRLDIDLSQVGVVDGAIMSLLVELRDDLSTRGVACELVGVPSHLEPIAHLYGAEQPPHPKAEPVRENPVSRLGRAVMQVVTTVEHVVLFFGDLAASFWRALRVRRTANWRAIPAFAVRAGADGVPIVLLLNFLVGFVMGFQTARQLKLYGANVYVADVVGISVTRELAPLMTAIIMSGRSGASFAAEIGTMRVTEEIDALRTMGFTPGPYLIFPRVAALALVAPVLTLLADVVGVTGGVFVGQTLGVSARGYLAELQTAVFWSDIWTGLVKSFAFGVAIGLIGCQQGFVTRGAAAGVGRSTTSTVVLCLFTIVIIDTLFTIVFRTFGK
ncbi:MAG TPA: MlaE family lipid ABC transporter permease subunit [Polyangiaceae bacterium]|nr:MlaE family lipid ABC transporter permease subunit [Polyangiaceae bacterium]